MLSTEKDLVIPHRGRFESLVRYYQSVSLVDNHVFVFGGKNFSIRDNSLFDLDLVEGREARLAAGDPPPERGAHSCVYYNGSLYLFGGEKDPREGQVLYKDFYRLNLSLFSCFTFV